MKIKSVRANNHKKCFEVHLSKGVLDFPYTCLDLQPTASNPVAHVYVDDELGREGFVYRLSNRGEDTVLADQVLFYNRDPAYMKKMLLYELTVEARLCLEQSRLSKREVIRRLGTSASQLYRLLDTTNYRKSIDQMIVLLGVLGCEVELRFKQALPAA